MIKNFSNYKNIPLYNMTTNNYQTTYFLTPFNYNKRSGDSP